MAFVIATVLLSLVRCIFPSVAGEQYSDQTQQDSLTDTLKTDTLTADIQAPDTTDLLFSDDTIAVDTVRVTEEKHRILGVRSYRDEFPDTNAVQLVAAQKYGVKPVLNRTDAEHRKGELVYVGSNPYFYINKLSASIPYLVPRASILLQDIGRNFFDSLQVKHVPLHKIKVTSVLRTKEDVEKLRKYNRNATENSCHLYGTTFDIGYNKYLTVSDPQGQPRREVRNDTLKFILSEVLRDLRNQNRCYIKYEVKQGCFHITVR